MKINYSIFPLLLLLAGCATQSVPAASVYTLSAPQQAMAAPARNEQQAVLKLAPVNAARVYHSTGMLYSDAPHARNSYAYSRWSDAPVVLLQTLLQDQLERSGQFAAVLPPVSSAKADLLLESTLFDFSQHIDTDGSAAGVISMRFYLVDNATRKVIKTGQFVASVPAATKDAQGAVTALNKAAAIISRDLVQWLAAGN